MLPVMHSQRCAVHHYPTQAHFTDEGEYVLRRHSLKQAPRPRRLAERLGRRGPDARIALTTV
jgi:hypothetical protein